MDMAVVTEGDMGTSPETPEDMGSTAIIPDLDPVNVENPDDSDDDKGCAAHGTQSTQPLWLVLLLVMMMRTRRREEA